MNDFTLLIFTLLFITVHCQYDYQVTTALTLSLVTQSHPDIPEYYVSVTRDILSLV